MKEVTTVRRTIARRILHVLLLSVVVLLGLHLFLQWLNLGVYHQQHGQFYELSNRFDFDDEASVPTWFAQFIYLLIAVGASLAAYLQPDRRTRLIWSVIATVSLFFSIDEIAGLHEFVLQTLHVIVYGDAKPSGLDNAWLLVAPVIIAVTGLFIYTMARTIPRRTIKFFSVAVVIFLIGAAGIDIVTSEVERETFLNQTFLSGIEESMELISLVIVIYALADYLERQHGKKFRALWQQLRSWRD